MRHAAASTTSRRTEATTLIAVLLLLSVVSPASSSAEVVLGWGDVAQRLPSEKVQQRLGREGVQKLILTEAWDHKEGGQGIAALTMRKTVVAWGKFLPPRKVQLQFDQGGIVAVAASVAAFAASLQLRCLVQVLVIFICLQLPCSIPHLCMSRLFLKFVFISLLYCTFNCDFFDRFFISKFSF